MSTQPETRHLSPAAHAISKPWYRHGWVWFLIAIPASSVVAGVITLWIALNKSDSLVADDYYKEGRGINQRLEKDQVAVNAGIALKASIIAAADGSQSIRVAFSAKSGVTAPEMIRLRLSHPTLDTKDVIATLVRDSAGIYETRIPAISSGRWYAQMEDDQGSWRIKTTWIIH